MAAIPAFYRTTIGKKVLMALTGFIGYAFVLMHMVGNLHIFEGPAEFNEYAEFLRTVGMPIFPYGGLLWVIRIVLLAAIITHVWLAIDLSVHDRASRPVRYNKQNHIQSSFASLTLRWGGIAIFLFIIYHITHLTLGWTHPNAAHWEGHESAYSNVIVAFSQPIPVLIYLVALFALGMHLYHGVWSIFQTFGLNSQRTNTVFRWLAILSGVGLFVGFSLVPVAVLLGLVK